MIGFVVAMEKEALLFLNETKINKNLTIAGKKIFLGKFLNHEYVLIISGIGKVNAGFSTQIIIDSFGPNTIINFGLAGAKLNSGLNAGDIVLVDKICQYDFDLSEIDNVNIGYMQDYDTTYYKTQYSMYSGDKFKICSCATGDRFTQKDYFLNIIKELSAQITDMESGAIAQVCLANNMPILCLKLISDVDGQNASIFEQYASNEKTVCQRIPNAIAEVVANLTKP